LITENHQKVLGTVLIRQIVINLITKKLMPERH